MLISLTSGVPVRTAQELRGDIESTACIAGHRISGVSPWRGDSAYFDITLFAVKQTLSRSLDILAERGYTRFISGLASGADLWAAEHILSMKQERSGIELIGAIPFMKHAERLNTADKRLLEMVERGADMLVTTSADPLMVYGKARGAHVSPDVYKERNYYMIDNSSAVAAFLNGSEHSGTLQTVSYARRRGRTVLRFGIDDVWRILDECGTDRDSIRRCIAELEWEWFAL